VYEATLPSNAAAEEISCFRNVWHDCVWIIGFWGFVSDNPALLQSSWRLSVAKHKYCV